MSNPANQNSVIHNESQLEEFCTQLDPEIGISIDTEFMRQKTYYAIPALVQIAQEQNGQILSTCIDAKEIKDWSALRSSLEQSVYCLAHSPDQDFEIFDQLFDSWSFTIYDTQIAAALLGEQTQISYAQLIQLTLNIELDKSQSRTDWLKRPLSPAQLEYALADVIHLPTAWKLLKQELVEKERLDWFLADSMRQVEKHKKTQHAQVAWRSVKGIKSLSGKEFAVAASLAQWREECARESDIPRRWMMADDAIMDLAQDHGKISVLSDRWSILRKYPDEVNSLLNNPRDIFINTDTKAFEPLSNQEKKSYSALKQYCVNQAEKLGVDPAAIANRKTLEKIVRGSTEFLNTDNWRHRILQSYINTHV